MQVYSEEYRGLRISVHEIDGKYACIIFIGAFGYLVIEQFVENVLPPTSVVSQSDGVLSRTARARRTLASVVAQSDGVL
jgi:hypothetical protein